MAQQNGDPIKLRWLDLDDEAFKNLLVAEALAPAEARQKKLEVLKTRLGIEANAGEDPLQAWLRAMAEENGLPVTQPAAPELAEVVTFSDGARRFLWALA